MFGDDWPGIEPTFSGWPTPAYRTFAYVQAEVESLAMQAAEAAK